MTTTSGETPSQLESGSETTEPTGNPVDVSCHYHYHYECSHQPLQLPDAILNLDRQRIETMALDKMDWGTSYTLTDAIVEAIVEVLSECP